ncbi:hypothetical protein J6590_076927 [Homalodisca vitripennis]|nr:hypothetical protein J6590_076927 [Homalodisca vitripennis]
MMELKMQFEAVKPCRAPFFSRARQLVREQVLSFTWIREGRVLVRSTPDGDTTRVCQLEERFLSAARLHTPQATQTPDITAEPPQTAWLNDDSDLMNIDEFSCYRSNNGLNQNDGVVIYIDSWKSTNAPKRKCPWPSVRARWRLGATVHEKKKIIF